MSFLARQVKERPLRLDRLEPKGVRLGEGDKEGSMFNVNEFVQACQGQQPSTIKEILTEALRDPESITKALADFGAGKDISQGAMGDMVIHRAPDLTIL